jgi:hypothetical protein
VRELSYDIEDCIDLFMHKMSKGGAKASLLKKTACKIEKIWSRRKIANLIEELKTRVKEESDRRWRYKIDDQAINFTKVVHIDPRLPALYEEAKKLVGIDGPREKIIEFLKNDDNGHQLKVVSVVGFNLEVLERQLLQTKFTRKSKVNLIAHVSYQFHGILMLPRYWLICSMTYGVLSTHQMTSANS